MFYSCSCNFTPWSLQQHGVCIFRVPLAAVDWSEWTEEEQLAALNKVLVARDRDVVMNAEELQEVLDKPQRLQLPSRAQSMPKRRSQESTFEVMATYNGITVKRPNGVSSQPRHSCRCLSDAQAPMDIVHSLASAPPVTAVEGSSKASIECWEVLSLRILRQCMVRNVRKCC